MIRAELVGDNRRAYFKFEKPVSLLSGRYEMRLQLSNPDKAGPLTVWYVDTPTYRGDAIKINGQILAGAMLYELLHSEGGNKAIDWEVHNLESSVLVLKNKEVPQGAYFVKELSEDVDWDDSRVKTTVWVAMLCG
jgi:hypothetical protein